jgi:hypothetical protein
MLAFLVPGISVRLQNGTSMVALQNGTSMVHPSTSSASAAWRKISRHSDTETGPMTAVRWVHRERNVEINGCSFECAHDSNCSSSQHREQHRQHTSSQQQIISSAHISTCNAPAANNTSSPSSKQTLAASSSSNQQPTNQPKTNNNQPTKNQQQQQQPTNQSIKSFRSINRTPTLVVLRRPRPPEHRCHATHKKRRSGCCRNAKLQRGGAGRISCQGHRRNMAVAGRCCRVRGEKKKKPKNKNQKTKTKKQKPKQKKKNAYAYAIKSSYTPGV